MHSSSPTEILPSASQHQIARNVQDAERRALIYWVNSFNNPYCLLASSSNDFKDGITFCELLAIYKKSPLLGVVREGPTTVEKCMRNISVAIQELKKCLMLAEDITPQDVYNDEDVMYELLRRIRRLFENKGNIAEKGLVIKPATEVVPVKSPSFAGTEKYAERPFFVSHKHQPSLPATRVDATVERSYYTRNPSPKKLSNLQHCSTPLSTELTPRLLPPKVSQPTERRTSVRKSATRQTSVDHSPDISRRASPKRTTTQWQIPNKMCTDVPRVSQAQKVDVKTKHKIVDWLQEISLIKKQSVSIAEFPGYCRNGVLLYDLIIRLEGRQTKLKKVDRNPKTQTAVLANVRKCLEHLRSFEKMNSRYLWSIQDVLEGNSDVIWGILDDMWYFYHNKASPFDPACSKVPSRISSKEPQRTNANSPSPFKKKSSLLPEYTTPSHRQDKSPIRADAAEKSPLRPSPMRTSRAAKASYSVIHSRSPLRNHSGSFSRKTERTFDMPLLGNSSRSAMGSRRGSLNSSMRSSGKDSFRFPAISEEKERLTRLWLKSLNLTVLAVQESENLLKNPYRNGLLLCELAEVLERTRLVGKILKPTAVRQAQQNIQRALRFFSERMSCSIPLYYLDSVECIQGILRGYRDAIWGLLNAIREVYPQTEPRNQPYLHLMDVNLPYSLSDIRRLEISILTWLRALGLIKSDRRLVSMLEIEHEIRNGTLLCELAQILAHKHLHGTFKDPKTDATALINLRKALECLRSLPRINPKFLWKEKEIFSGDRGTILGLFEELHKYYDGATNYRSSVGPYLGLEEIDASITYDYCGNSSFSQGRLGSTKVEETANHEERAFEYTIPVEMPLMISEKVPLIKESTLAENGTIKNLELVPSESSLKSPIIQNINGSLPHSRKHERSENLPPRHPYKPQVTLRRKLFNFERADDIKPSQNYGSTAEPEPLSVVKNPNESLEQWIKTIVKVPDTFTLNTPVLEFFRDGTLLCQLVEKLEKKSIEGIVRRPTSSASALHNIRKALEVLGQKNVIPSFYMYSAEGIFEGDYELITGLLKNVRHAYRNCSQSTTKGTALRSKKGSFDMGRKPLHETDWN